MKNTLIAPRDYIIDNSRGFGILLVVLGHIPIDSSFSLWIYSFHMPLFTFISGCFINSFSVRNCLNKMNRLLVPFFIYSIISWIGYLILVAIYHPEYLMDQLRKIVYIFAGSGQNAIGLYGNGNVTMWFLSFLFVVICMYWVLSWMKIKLVGAFMMILAAYACSVFEIKLPANIDTAFLLFPFFYLGTFYKIWAPILKQRFPKMAVALIIPFLLICQFLIAQSNGGIDTASNVFGKSILLFYVVAILGIFSTMLFWGLINGPIFTFWSKNSIVYLIFNLPLIRLSELFLASLNIQHRFLQSTSVFLFTIIAIIPIAFIIRRYFPKSIGVKSLF